MGISDTTLPAVSISSPANNSTVSNPSITVSGVASDSIALSKVEVKLNSGSFATATGTTSWSLPVTLVSGANTITARDTDTSNNIKETSITVTYTPPNTAPSAPQTLTSIARDNSVSLTWLAPSSNGGSAITGYKIYRGTSSGSETLLATGGCSSLGNVLTCVDATVANGTAYYYQATAINIVGESVKSNETVANPQVTRIQGTVSNSAPISGATVTDGTRTAATDASGNYTINTTAGTYTLTASKSGYVSSSKSVTVSTAQTATVNFTLYETDIISPNISGGSPSGTLAYNTTQANLTITTDENAACKYSASAGAAYSSISDNFATTGTTTHSQTITNLTSGQSYSYYVRCKDGQKQQLFGRLPIQDNHQRRKAFWLISSLSRWRSSQNLRLF